MRIAYIACEVKQYNFLATVKYKFVLLIYIKKSLSNIRYGDTVRDKRQSSRVF